MLEAGSGVWAESDETWIVSRSTNKYSSKAANKLIYIFSLGTIDEGFLLRSFASNIFWRNFIVRLIYFQQLSLTFARAISFHVASAADWIWTPKSGCSFALYAYVCCWWRALLGTGQWGRPRPSAPWAAKWSMRPAGVVPKVKRQSPHTPERYIWFLFECVALPAGRALAPLSRITSFPVCCFFNSQFEKKHV